MERKTQKEFYFELLENMKVDFEQNANKIPREWGGVELREYLQYAAKKFEAPGNLLTKSRKKDIENDILLKNL